MSYISAAQAKQIAQKAVDNLKDGTLVPKLAENLTPYAEDSGTTQTQPFFLEGTATGNGESRVDAKQVPAFAFLQEKRGNMVNVNQRVNKTTLQFSSATTTVSGEKITITSTATQSGSSCYSTRGISKTAIKGHTVLMRVKASHSWGLNVDSTYPTYMTGETNIILTFTTNTFIFFPLGFNNVQAGDEQVFDYFYIHDLTQWFNGNIPAYLLSHPEAFGRYYKGSLAAYEPGRLEPATGRYFESDGRNIWDEEWEVGSIGTDGKDNDYDTDDIRSKNYIDVSALTSYYFNAPGLLIVCFYDENKNFISIRYPSDSNGRIFTTPANCRFVRIATYSYGATYKNDITISRYYPGESGYDQYYPHEVLAKIDTGTEQLGAFDYKVPSGLITRATGSYTFTGNETVIDNGTYAAFSGLTALINAKPLTTNIICSVGLVALTSGVANTPMSISFGSAVNINIDNVGANVLNYMAGKTIYFELATPTTEQGTPFQENVPIDDFGQLSWSDTNVPQGNQIFYPVDYKAYEDTLIKYTDGDATSLALKNAITDAALNARGYYKMEDLSSSCISANDSNLTFSITKAVKMNGLVNLTLRASNGTGASISAGTVLFTLSNNTHRSEQIKVIGVIDTASQVFNISSIGQVTCNGAIADGSTLHLYVSFIVT